MGGNLDSWNLVVKCVWIEDADCRMLASWLGGGCRILDSRERVLGWRALAGVLLSLVMSFYEWAAGSGWCVGFNVVVPREIAACLGLIWQSYVTFGQLGWNWGCRFPSCRQREILVSVCCEFLDPIFSLLWIYPSIAGPFFLPIFFGEKSDDLDQQVCYVWLVHLGYSN